MKIKELSPRPLWLFNVECDADGGVFAGHYLDAVGTPGGFDVEEVVEVGHAALGADGDNDFVAFVFHAVVVECGQLDEAVFGGVVMRLNDVLGVPVEFVGGVLRLGGLD